MPTRPGKPSTRTVWAAERTLLAWLRTSISLLAFGFVVARFELFLHRAPQAAGSLIGAALAGLGGLFAVLAVTRYRQEVYGYNRTGPKPWLGVTAGVAVALAAAVVTGYLLRHNLTL